MDVLEKAIELDGKQAIIINTNTKIILKPCNDVEFNYLYTHSPIFQGNLVKVKNDTNNDTYIVVEKQNNLVDTYNKAKITKAQNIIYKNKEIPCYIKSLIDVVDKTEYFNQLDNKLEVTIPDNEEIDINDIITYKNSDFKIISIDNTKEGLLTFIAEFKKNAEPIVYTITAPKEIILEENETKQIQVVAKKNEVIDSKATLTYSVENKDICTIENNIITALKEGNTTITITYNNVNSVINIIVRAKEKEIKQENKEDFSGTFTLNCPDKIKIGETAIVTITPARKTVTYKLEDSDGIGEIVSQENGECIVKALKEDYMTVVAFSPNGTRLAEDYILGY